MTNIRSLSKLHSFIVVLDYTTQLQAQPADSEGEQAAIAAQKAAYERPIEEQMHNYIANAKREADEAMQAMKAHMAHQTNLLAHQQEHARLKDEELRQLQLKLEQSEAAVNASLPTQVSHPPSDETPTPSTPLGCRETEPADTPHTPQQPQLHAASELGDDIS